MQIIVAIGSLSPKLTLANEPQSAGPGGARMGGLNLELENTTVDFTADQVRLKAIFETEVQRARQAEISIVTRSLKTPAPTVRTRESLWNPIPRRPGTRVSSAGANC